MGYTGLMDRCVIQGGLIFYLLYPMWFNKSIFRIVTPVITWVQKFLKNPGVGRFGTPPLIAKVTVLKPPKGDLKFDNSSPFRFGGNDSGEY